MLMLTQKLAEFVINTSVSDMPPEALDGARDALIDTIGCALAGTPEEVCRIVVRFLRTQGGQCTGDGLGGWSGDDGERCGVRQRRDGPRPRL